ncbi:MAG: AMP-binding protein [Deltaproteobacteria bacterium]|nr:AMP-binding protein [Deltaproteobacteria bacterium]
MTETEPTPVSFGRRISDLAAERPKDIALVFVPRSGGGQERSFSWADVERRSLQIAGLMRQQGVGQDAMLIVGLPNSPEHVFTALAAWKLGAGVLPLRWDLPEWERNRLIEVVKPRLVCSDWNDVPAACMSMARLEASTDAAAEPLEDRVADPARAIASSGSTGLPKIIVKPGPGEGIPGAGGGPFERDPEMGARRELVLAPLYHTNGFFMAHAALFGGDHVVLMERFDAARAADLIERHRIQAVTMVPTMLQRIARLPDLETRDFSSLELVLQGGAACPGWLVRRWIELVGPQRFVMSYGSTEGVGLTVISGDEWLDHPGSVGKAQDSEIRILDETGREVSAGVIGEIFMRPTADDAPGFEYKGAPPPKRSDDGLTSIGDMGWLDEDGYLFVADRRQDMIISGGANIFPAEIEAALSEHPEVVDSAVIGLPDEEWGQCVHALIQPRDATHAPSSAELRAHCRARLAAYKVPKAFETMERLPRSEAGKLNRSELVNERSGDAV